MAGLIQTNENLNLYNEIVDKSVLSTDRLGSALRSLSNLLPVQDIIKLQDSFANLNRTLALNYNEVSRLTKSVDSLAAQTRQYSKVEIAGMIQTIAKSNSALSANISNVGKLTKTFSQAFRQGGQQFLQLYVKMNEVIPQLEARTASLSDSVTTLNEVFKVGGKEGVAAYLASIGKLSDETLKVENTLSDSFKRLEKRFTDFKTSLGEGASGGLLKNIVDIAAGSDVGMLGVGAGSLLLANMLRGRAVSGIRSALGIPGMMGGTAGPVGMPAMGPTWQTIAGMTTYGQFSGGPLNTMTGVARRAGRLVGAGRNFVNNNATALGIGSYAIGQFAGEDTAVGSAASLAGAGLTGASVGGPWGAVVGLLVEGGRQIMNSKQRKEDERYKRFQERMDREQNAKRAALEQEMNSLAVSDGNGPDWFARQANAALSLAGRSGMDITDSIALRMKGRDLAARSYSISSAQFGSASSQFQTSLEFNPLSANSSGAIRALDQRSTSIRGLLEALTAGGANAAPEEVAKLRAEEASIRRERLSLLQAQSLGSASLFGSRAGALGAQAQGSLQAGGPNALSDFNALVNAQKQYLESIEKELGVAMNIAKERGNEVEAAKLAEQIQNTKNQRIGLELQQSEKILRNINAQYTVAQKFVQLGSLKGAGSELIGLGMEEGNIRKQLALADQGRLTLTEEQRFQFGNRLEQIGVEKTAGQIRQRLETIETERASFETIASASGVLGEQEKTKLAEQRLNFLKEQIRLEQEGKLIIDSNAKAMNEANQKALEIQIAKSRSFGQERQALEFQRDINDKQLQIAQITKNPFIASKFYQQQIGISQEMIGNKERELADARGRGLGEDSAEVQRIKSDIMSERVKIAQQLDFQRRTFAEQFTAQTINMTNGSYLFPGMSESQMIGSGYYEGKSAEAMFGKRRGPNTYSGQVEAVFGEGMSERSPWENMADQLIEGLTSGDTVLNVKIVGDDGVNTKYRGEMPN